MNTLLPKNFDSLIREAVGRFWAIREAQGKRQEVDGAPDQGSRRNVTGGKQMDGLIELFSDLLSNNGVPRASIYRDRALELPGYFRPTKQWDLLVVHKGVLLAAMEAKSQVGSFGNNCNNRVEEAVGSATDLWAAYREGAFGSHNPPWLGYLFLLEEHPKAKAPVRVAEPHYEVFEEFKAASYEVRYQELCQRLVMEKLYTSACLLTSPRGDAKGEALREPSRMLSAAAFTQSLISSVLITLQTI